MSVDTVAQFAAQTSWQSLPAGVREHMRGTFIDTLGCLLGGTATPAFAAAARAATRRGAPMTACALGVAASALDFDDGHYEGGGVHLGAVILPTLLAIAPNGIGAEPLLGALAVGYEIAIRSGYLMAPRAAYDPYHTSGGPSSIGAAAAAAKLVGLNVEGIRRAIRIASAHAPMATLQLPMVKEAIGWGAATAVGAVCLAEAGFDGIGAAVTMPPILGIAPTPFDGPRAAEPFVATLGKTWQSSQTYLKPYPCCRAIHSAIDGVFAILADTGWTCDVVDRVEVVTMPGIDALAFLPPPSLEHAQFSIPFAIGCLLATGRVASTAFLAGDWDPAIIAAAGRVTIRGDAGIAPLSPSESYPVHISVSARGETRNRQINHALGSAARPLSPDAVRAKFLQNASLVLPAEQALGLLGDLEGPVESIDLSAFRTILKTRLEIGV